MKKITLLFALLITASFTFGQIHLGPKIGFNTNKLTTDLSEFSSDFQSNFHFGAFLRLGKKIYVQPEVNWMTNGGIFKRPELTDVSPIDQEISLKTIEIPLIVGWRIANLGVGNIRVFAGPSASIVTDKTIESNDTEGYISPITDADIEDLIWGINVGAGVDILMFTLDVRYQMGLSDFVKEVQAGGENLQLNSRTNVFAISLGWKII